MVRVTIIIVIAKIIITIYDTAPNSKPLSARSRWGHLARTLSTASYSSPTMGAAASPCACK